MESTELAATPQESKLVTFRQAAKALGLSKTSLYNFVKDPDDPIPYEKNEDGWNMVRLEDVRAYLDRHPNCGRSWKAEVDRTPADPNAPEGNYMLLSELAKASGLAVSTVRDMTKKAKGPLPSTRNAEGWVLVDERAFWEYLERRGSAPEEETPATAYYAADLAEYPELAELPGTYHAAKAIANAINLPESMVREWANDPFDPIPCIRKGKRVFINKYRVPAYAAKREQSAAFPVGAVAAQGARPSRPQMRRR